MLRRWRDFNAALQQPHSVALGASGLVNVVADGAPHETRGTCPGAVAGQSLARYSSAVRTGDAAAGR